MPEQSPPTICPECQSPIVEKKGISRKTGKPYQFFGCANYPNCDYVWHPEPELKPAQEIIRETKVIPILRLDEKDKEELLGALREIWKQNEEIKGILEKMKKVEILYPDETKETYLEPK